MAKITTPVEGFTGAVVGVSFTDGVGETSDPALLAYFSRHGYGVADDTEGKRTRKAPAPKPDAD